MNQTWLGRVNRFLAADPWAQTVISVAVVLPLVSAAAVAVTGRQTAAGFGMAGLPGIVVTAWAVRRGGWDLSGAERMTVWDTKLSGRSSGDQYLDAIAAYQLHSCTRSQLADKVALTGLVVASAVGPVVAALRTGNGWWLVALLVPVVLAVIVAPRVSGEPCADRLQRLTNGAPTQRPARRRGDLTRPKGRSAR